MSLVCCRGADGRSDMVQEVEDGETERHTVRQQEAYFGAGNVTLKATLNPFLCTLYRNKICLNQVNFTAGNKPLHSQSYLSLVAGLN